MTVHEPEVSPLTRHVVHAFLLVFAITGVARLELMPFSGFRLFSELRSDERTAWQLRAELRDGHEVPIDLGELSLGYRQTTRLIPAMEDMSDSERDAICEAWAGPLRDEGTEVAAVRVYKTITLLGAEDRPPERSLLFECGGGAR